MIKPNQLPNTITTPSADYPYGQLKDDSVPNDGLGTPVRADWQMDAYADRLEVLDRAGIVPNGLPETATSNQFADAIEAIIDDHIDANLIDNAHMADMPTMTIKGNDAGLSTDPQDLTVSEVKTMLALQNVTNESKATMFTNPAFTGTPTAPSAVAATDNTQVATTEFVHDAIAADTDYLADFRVWDATRTYILNEPVFYNGVPYRSLNATNLNNIPSSSPTYWENLSVASGAIPIGGMIEYAGSTAPTANWGICDGTAYNRTTHAALFSVIGTTYGAGDGSTTFNVPDMRAASPAGAGTSTGYTQNETVALGAKINDQLQGFRLNFAGRSDGAGAGSRNTLQPTSADTTFNTVSTFITDGTNGTPRIGNTTHGKLVGVNYLIRIL